MTRFACVVLVDPRGWVLLQERDEHARIAPERWSYSGGHVEPGESDLDAAVRELAEETGIEVAAADLRLHGHFDLFHPETRSQDTIAFFTAPTELTDDDVVLGEGRQIVFVDPEVARGLPLSDLAATTLPAFLDSDLYAELSRRPA
ncbi:NUDIX hydrolase [Nocardioides sp. GY 10113]|uniref:NUDIX domain-containing protein n=1 Tax=Nocardioides sp. GY 10113 TaxID=2569761 RepID=UPI0010A831DB|nr:NUDIX hydrolase [Nocardioides sp. GY 10113]TIC83871.1 NUDIX hydrolase [Nocardioides sp. GY 10113]